MPRERKEFPKATWPLNRGNGLEPGDARPPSQDLMLCFWIHDVMEE